MKGSNGAFGFAMRFGIVLALAVGLAVPAGAQVQFGVLTGTVTDPTGAVIPGAEVTVTNLGTGSARTITTNSAGVYRAGQLLVGLYNIEVTAPGFKTGELTNVIVNVGAIARQDFQLEVGATTEVVTVEAGATLINTEDARLATQVVGRQIQDLPLNGRNVYNLIRLAPGAANATGVSFENGEGTVVNGLRPNFNGFLINGSSNKGLSGGSSTKVNPDLVAEFQMLTLNMSAQYGNSAAAITNLVTKSGTNDFHGSGFYFFRNDKLDANEFFRNLNASSDPTSTDFALNNAAKVRFNQFGGTLTGPIVKDKVFFTTSFQVARFETQAQAVPIVVESPAWRQALAAANSGSVAALLYNNFATTTVGTPLQTLRQYVEGGGGGFGSTSFGDYLCGDISSRPSVAAQFQRLFGVTAQDITDMTAAGCTSIPGLQAGLINRDIQLFNSSVAVFGAQSQTFGDLTDGEDWSVRLDWAGTNHRIFGEFYWQASADRVGPANNSSGPRGILNPQVIEAPNFQSSWVYTASPTVVNDLRVGFSRNKSFVDVDANGGVPSISFGDGSAGFGSYNGYPQFFIENIYTYSDMLSVTKGSHNLKFGVEYRDNRENSEFNVGRPSYYFFDQLFFAIDEPLLQIVGVDPGFTTGLARLQTNNRAWFNFEVGMFVQDDWKVTPNLTLNLGFRYDYFDRHKERFGRQTTFILGPGVDLSERFLNANIPAGDPGCDTPDQIRRVVLAGVCGPGGFTTTNTLGAQDRDNFGPRVGLAWDPFGKGKTAIRAGWGISFEGTLYNPLSNSRWNPPFYSFNLAFNDLVGGSDLIIYGPSVLGAGPDGILNTLDDSASPSGEAPSFSGGTANPGAGDGVLGLGNIQGWAPGNGQQAFLTGIVFPEGIDDPWIMNYHVGFQHQVAPNTVVEINYVGTRGFNLFRAQQGNRARGTGLPQDQDPGPDGILDTADDIFTDSSQLVQGEIITGRGRRRLNPNYGVMRIWQNSTDSWYNSLQATVRKTMSHGVMFNTSYTWSHSIDTGSGWHSGAVTANGSAAGDGFSLDLARPELDRGNSTFDIRHRIVGSWVWDLPMGKNLTGAARKLLHGWQWNGLFSAQTGAHFTAYTTSSFPLGDFNADGERNDRPDVGAGGDSFNAGTDDWANGWFNSPGSPFSGPLSGATPFFAVPCQGCNGNLGRNTFEGPDQFTIDASLFKNTEITEGVTIQFRFEVFNVLNHTNFFLPSSATGANFANRLASPIFGASAGTSNARNIQFGLKVLF